MIRQTSTNPVPLFENLEQRALMAGDFAPAFPSATGLAPVIVDDFRVDQATPFKLSGELPTQNLVPNAAANQLRGIGPLLPGNRGTFTDADGDIITIRLSGPGVISVNPGGTTSYGVINLQDTTDRSTLSITVSRRGTGDGIGNVDLIDGSGALRALSASRINILGNGVADVGIRISGFANAISIRDLRNGADIRIGGDQTRTGSLSIRGANVGQNTVDSTIAYGETGSTNRPNLSSVTFRQAQNVVVTAGTIRSFRSLISTADGLDGSLNNVDLDLTNQLTRGFVLGSATVQGDISTSEWIIQRGGIGNVSIRDSFDLELQVLGQSERNISLNSLSAREADSLAISTLGAVRNISAWQWTGGSLAATQASSIKINGNSAAALPGNLSATFGFTTQSTATVLNSLFVRGNFTGLIATQSSLGTLSFGGLFNATIAVGASRSDFATTGGLPASQTGLFTGQGGNIRSITLRAPTATNTSNYVNSYVVANTIGTLNFDLRGADVTNGDDTFGVATTAISSARTRTVTDSFSGRNLNVAYFSTPRGVAATIQAGFTDTSGSEDAIADMVFRFYPVDI